MRTVRSLGIAFVGLMLVACSQGGQAPGRVRVSAPAGGGSVGVASEVRILSAHLAERGAPELGGRDGIVVVFSEQVDPATLLARMLLVVSKEGHRMVPERAVLSPARRGQTRTVLLIGEFTGEDRDPSDIVVVGSLFTETGVSLRGFSQPVASHDRPDRVVLAHRLRGDGQRCMGAPQIVRTYWSDRLGSEGEVELGTVRLWLDDGRQLTPVGIERAADRGSNVVDLCVRADSPVRHLRVDAGAFHDAAGHASAEVDLSVSDLPAVRR